MCCSVYQTFTTFIVYPNAVCSPNTSTLPQCVQPVCSADGNGNGARICSRWAVGVIGDDAVSGVDTCTRLAGWWTLCWCAVKKLLTHSLTHSLRFVAFHSWSSQLCMHMKLCTWYMHRRLWCTVYPCCLATLWECPHCNYWSTRLLCCASWLYLCCSLTSLVVCDRSHHQYHRPVKCHPLSITVDCLDTSQRDRFCSSLCLQSSVVVHSSSPFALAVWAEIVLSTATRVVDRLVILFKVCMGMLRQGHIDAVDFNGINVECWRCCLLLLTLQLKLLQVDELSDLSQQIIRSFKIWPCSTTRTRLLLCVSYHFISETDVQTTATAYDCMHYVSPSLSYKHKMSKLKMKLTDHYCCMPLRMYLMQSEWSIY